MDTLTIGPLILKRELLLWILAALTGYGIMRWRMKDVASGERIGSVLLSAGLWGLIVWKGSAVLFDPMEVLRHPMTLLYFTGGLRGALLGLLIALLYIWLQARKAPEDMPYYVDSILIAGLGGYSTKFFLDLFFTDVYMIRYALVGLLGAIVVTVWMRKSKTGDLRAAAQYVVIFLIAHALLNSLAANLWEKTAAADSAAAASTLRIGQPAPDFEVQNLDGETVKLSDYRGKTVILNFWATWCPPCKAEMPHMQRFYTEYKEKDVVILGMNATTTEASPSVVDAWVKEWGLTFPIPLDTKGQVIETYRIQSYPTTYIIDKNGNITYRYLGPMSFEMLKEATGF